MSSLLGGVLIGASASLLLWLDGRIGGASGIVNGLMPPALWFVPAMLAGSCLQQLTMRSRRQ